MINIFGDHFFHCRFQSKIGLHNWTRDTHFLAFWTVAPWCAVVNFTDDVLLEATSLANCYPRKKPVDVALCLMEKIFFYPRD